MSGFSAVGYFLITLFFSLVLFVLWARVILRYFKISALHPVHQVINSFTDQLVNPVEKLFFPPKKRSRRYDWACFTVIIIVEVIKFILLSLLIYYKLMPLSYLMLFVLSDLITQPCNLFFYLILIRVVMSWVNPTWQNPAAEVMKRVTDPLLDFGRCIIPDISGFDFSPFIIMLILKVITLFMSASLPARLVY